MKVMSKVFMAKENFEFFSREDFDSMKTLWFLSEFLLQYY